MRELITAFLVAAIGLRRGACPLEAQHPDPIGELAVGKYLGHPRGLEKRSHSYRRSASLSKYNTYEYIPKIEKEFAFLAHSESVLRRSEIVTNNPELGKLNGYISFEPVLSFPTRGPISSDEFNEKLRWLLIYCDRTLDAIKKSQIMTFDGCVISVSDELAKALVEAHTPLTVASYDVEEPHKGLTFFVSQKDPETTREISVGTFSILDPHFHDNFLFLMDAVPFSNSTSLSGLSVILEDKWIFQVNFGDDIFALLDVIYTLDIIFKLDATKQERLTQHTPNEAKLLYVQKGNENPKEGKNLSDKKDAANKMIWTFKVESANSDDEQIYYYFCYICQKSNFHAVQGVSSLGIIAASNTPLKLNYLNRRFRTKRFPFQRRFVSVEDQQQQHVATVLRHLTVPPNARNSSTEDAKSLDNVLHHSIPLAVVIIGRKALFIFGGFNMPQYPRVPVDIDPKWKLPSVILFNPVIMLNRRRPVDQVRMMQLNKNRSRFRFAVRRIESAGKFNTSFTNHLVIPAANEIGKKITNETCWTLDLFDPKLRVRNPRINFDELSMDQKNDAIDRYSYGLRTFGSYMISGKLVYGLLMQLPWWPRNFILTVLQRPLNEEGMEVFFYYHDPKSENNVKLTFRTPVYDPFAGTIDVGIHNPKYVRVFIRNYHADSIVGDAVECRLADGNCIFYSILGSMTPEMRAEFFANANHKYNEDNYSEFTKLALSASITEDDIKKLEALHAAGIAPGMSADDFNYLMRIRTNCLKLKGVREDVQFLRNEIDNVFKQNPRQYIEKYGLPDE